MEREEQPPQEQIMGTEEALAKLYMELLNPTGEKLKTVTDVTPQEVFGMPVMLIFGRLFGSKITNDYAEDFMRLRISRTRTSRQEFVFLGSGLAGLSTDRKAKGLGDLFAGLGR